MLNVGIQVALYWKQIWFKLELPTGRYYKSNAVESTDILIIKQPELYYWELSGDKETINYY